MPKGIVTITCDTKEKALIFRSFLDHIIETNLNVRIREEALDHVFKIYHQEPKNRKHISNLIRLNEIEIRKKTERYVSITLRIKYEKQKEEIVNAFKKRMNQREKHFQENMKDIRRLVRRLSEKVN